VRRTNHGWSNCRGRSDTRPLLRTGCLFASTEAPSTSDQTHRTIHAALCIQLCTSTRAGAKQGTQHEDALDGVNQSEVVAAERIAAHNLIVAGCIQPRRPCTNQLPCEAMDFEELQLPAGLFYEWAQRGTPSQDALEQPQRLHDTITSSGRPCWLQWACTVPRHTVHG
jgi:hypothetical protein